MIERLLELKPERLPGAIVWPGFDESVLSPTRAREDVRRDLGVAAGEIVLVYTGNIHETNLDAMRELYLSVALASQERRAGRAREDGLELCAGRVPASARRWDS